jgi:hypothetical protein
MATSFGEASALLIRAFAPDDDLPWLAQLL